tara:strand:- start:413 stop:2419 length:2007 start_codon:yes stop_codon:yes gene_type:complete
MNLVEIKEWFNKYKASKTKLQNYFRNNLCSNRCNTLRLLIDEDNKIINRDKFKELIKKGKLTKTNLQNICNYMFNTHNSDVLLHNILKNPYYFVYISTKPLINYQKANHISQCYDIESSENERDKAWIHDYITSNNKNNSFYVSESVVYNDYYKYFHKNIDVNVLEQLCVKRNFDGEEYYTSEKFDKIESFIANTVNNKNCICDYDCNNVSTYIQQYEEDFNISFNPEQKKCIRYMIKYNIFLIHGYPGVGKSTIVDVYCKYKLDNLISNGKIYIVAPTGMAVKNIQKKINSCSNRIEFSTIHKLIHNNRNMQYDEDDENENEINIETLIVDESSMIDTLLMYDIMKLVDEYDCNIIFLGDYNQLPPIGMGEPFKYFLNCESLPKVHLNVIKRQDESKLKDTIKLIIEDPFDIDITNFDDNSYDNSLSFIDTNAVNTKNMCYINTDEDNTKKSFQYNNEFIKNIIKKYDLNEYNSKFISPCNAYEAGVQNINIILQGIYNSIFENNGKVSATITRDGKEKLYKEGDLILLTKNISNSNYVNGDFFKLTNIENLENNEYKKYNMIRFNDENKESRTVDVDEMFDIHTLGYACTIHKVQGSQFEKIVLLMDKKHMFQWSNNNAIKLLYTAISRAQKRCIIIGDSKMFYKALIQDKDDNKTLLTNIVRLIV